MANTVYKLDLIHTYDITLDEEIEQIAAFISETRFSKGDSLELAEGIDAYIFQGGEVKAVIKGPASVTFAACKTVKKPIFGKIEATVAYVRSCDRALFSHSIDKRTAPKGSSTAFKITRRFAKEGYSERCDSFTLKYAAEVKYRLAAPEKMLKALLKYSKRNDNILYECGGVGAPFSNLIDESIDIAVTEALGQNPDLFSFGEYKREVSKERHAAFTSDVYAALNERLSEYGIEADGGISSVCIYECKRIPRPSKETARADYKVASFGDSNLKYTAVYRINDTVNQVGCVRFLPNTGVVASGSECFAFSFEYKGEPRLTVYAPKEKSELPIYEAASENCDELRDYFARGGYNGKIYVFPKKGRMKIPVATKYKIPEEPSMPEIEFDMEVGYSLITADKALMRVINNRDYDECPTVGEIPDNFYEKLDAARLVSELLTDNLYGIYVSTESASLAKRHSDFKRAYAGPERIAEAAKLEKAIEEYPGIKEKISEALGYKIDSVKITLNLFTV